MICTGLRDDNECWHSHTCLAHTGNNPYWQVKPLMEDVKSLFAKTKKLHGQHSSQAEHVRSLQRLWLSKCSDHLEQCPPPRAEALHEAWHGAEAEHDGLCTLTAAHQHLQQTVEDTAHSKSNNASQYIAAVKRALHLLYVSAVFNIGLVSSSGCCLVAQDVAQHCTFSMHWPLP